MLYESLIYVAGHQGLVGSAITRKLKQKGYHNLLFKNSAELDLRRQRDVEKFFEKYQPDHVFMAAAKVGGIHANNSYPADFIYDNIMIQTNIIEAAYRYGTKKLLFLGSSCIYPKYCRQPMKEEYLLSGELEPTNEAYAIAKIAGVKMCQSYNKQFGTNFVSVMPTNLYGPNDNFDLETSHVLPALVRKFYEAKVKRSNEVVVWGTGEVRREFLHVDDLADAVVFLMNNYNGADIINIGTGQDISIHDLALIIKEVVGYEGKIIYDKSKPVGTQRKLLDVSKLNSLGWKSEIGLREGIEKTLEWFVEKNRNNENLK